MASKYQSKAGIEKRKAQNKGVKHGTIRTGAGGRTTRRYNARTGRWNAVSVKSSASGASLTTRKARAGAVVQKAASSRKQSMSRQVARRRASQAATRYTQYKAPSSSSGSAKTSSFFDDPLNLKGGRKSNFFSTRFRGRSSSNPVR